MNYENKEKLINLLKIMYIVLSYFIVDFILRFATRWLGYYSIFKLAPSLFSVCWINIIAIILLSLPKWYGKIFYAVTYFIFVIYSIVQYVYYLIFNKFIVVTDFLYAGEGFEYLDYAIDVIDWKLICIILFFSFIGIMGIKNFPELNKNNLFIKLVIVLSSVLGIIFIPNMFEKPNEDTPLFHNSSYEYEQFTNSGFDMEICGLYQYIARDIWCSFLKPMPDKKDLVKNIESLNLEGKHVSNEMTGSLNGKNIILVQLESLDDWVVNEKSTPTIYKMMNEGINFTNMYTSLYGSGSTFSTEFAFNTGIYQSTQGTAAYSTIKNHYPYSLANILKGKGYSANSFHQNTGNYYNREVMHPTMGYEKYYSIRDFMDASIMAEVDSELIKNDGCWNKITSNEPFFSFLITYSVHVPYNKNNELSQYAINVHPEYNDLTENEELNYLYAKARLTDDMFKELLNRLEEDNLLNETVIIAYDDHYNYGLSDKNLVLELSEENGSSILEKTPAFIWYEGCESLEVNKICQTIDWVPTIANMFGIDVSGKVLGQDIFDENYEGYAIFPNGSWLCEDAYVVNGNVKWNNGISEENIRKMNEYVGRFYEANEEILKSDYYSFE